MKKLLFAVTAAAVILTSCEKQNVTPDKGEYVYYEPCLNWGADQDAVYNYMAGLDGWKEENDEKSESHLAFTNTKTNANMNYTFNSEGLSAAGVTYFGVNDKFETMKSDVSSHHGITSWKDQQVMAGVTWFTAGIKDKSCDVSVGWSDNLGGYMYADYSFSHFVF